MSSEDDAEALLEEAEAGSDEGEELGVKIALKNSEKPPVDGDMLIPVIVLNWASVILQCLDQPADLI